MAIAILLLVLGCQVLPSECLTVDICSADVPHINDGRVNVSSPGYPNTHEIPRNGLKCSCFVRTGPNSMDSLEVSPIVVSYRACDDGGQQCDTSCWSSLDFWTTSHVGERTVCLPQTNFTANITLLSTALTNVTYAANAPRRSEFTYRGRFLFSINARRAQTLQIFCGSGLTTTPRFSTTIPSSTSTNRRKSRTRTSGATSSTITRPSTDVSTTEPTTSTTPTRSTGSSTSSTASSMTSSEFTTLSSTATASTTTVSTTDKATTMVPDKSTIGGETTTSTGTTVSDATTSLATETVTDTASTSTVPNKSTSAAVSDASTASETKEYTTDTRTSIPETRTSMASELTSTGTGTSIGLTDSTSPTTRGTFSGTSADHRSTATVVSPDLHSTAVHITSEYPKPFHSETTRYEDSTTAETTTAAPVPSRKLIILVIILAILLLVLLLIIIIICCVKKSRKKEKSGLYVVTMSGLQEDDVVQSPDDVSQPIRSHHRGQGSCPSPLHLLLQKASKKNRGESTAAAAAAAADYDKPPCCSYKRQTSDGYAPMGSNAPGRAANSNRTNMSSNVYADLDNITKKQRGGLEHGTAGNPIITITDADDGDYYNRPRSGSHQSDVHAYETCYSPDGATKLSASGEYEHTYAAIQGRKDSIDSLKTESPYSIINEDRLYSTIDNGQGDETDREKKRDEENQSTVEPHDK